MITAAVIDWGGVAAIGGLMLAMLGGMIKLVLLAGKIATLVESHTHRIEQNARHLDSLITAQWQTITRVATAEDFLQDQLGYRPPVLIPRPHAVDGDGDRS